jgi:hypothetical protein
MACSLFLPLLLLLSISGPHVLGQKADNPNVWNFQIARKIIAAFQFNGMEMSIWEDQGVENTTVTSRRQFYVTPITEFLPNMTQCEQSDLSGANYVSYVIQVWNERLQLAAVDRLKQMQIEVAAAQVQPLPFYQVRVIWNSAQEKLQKASLSTTWNNNLQQQSIHRFRIFTDDKETCQKITTTLQTKPNVWTDSIALQYSLSAASTATRVLSVKTEHFLNSKLMASLKNMDVKSPERLLTSDDANRLTMEVMDNIVATQVVDGEYVPEADQLTLKDLVKSSLQFVNADIANFTQQVWQSVFWDPIYARPDTVSSYLNKVLNINQGNHTVSKSNSYTNKGEGGANFGIGRLFSFGGHGGGESTSSASYSELYEWLLQHNYDVEIQGQIFVPKSLKLQKLNLGVLNKQETIFSKSVQMRHVDAPGVLKVTTGSKSLIESEDIKKLREDAASLAATISQVQAQLSAKIEEVRVGAANALGQNIGAVQATIEQVRVYAASATGTKISECQLCQTRVNGVLEDLNGVLRGRFCSLSGHSAWSGVPLQLGVQFDHNWRVTIQCR